MGTSESAPAKTADGGSGFSGLAMFRGRPLGVKAGNRGTAAPLTSSTAPPPVQEIMPPTKEENIDSFDEENDPGRTNVIVMDRVMDHISKSRAPEATSHTIAHVHAPSDIPKNPCLATIESKQCSELPPKDDNMTAIENVEGSDNGSISSQQISETKNAVLEPSDNVETNTSDVQASNNIEENPVPKDMEVLRPKSPTARRISTSPPPKATSPTDNVIPPILQPTKAIASVTFSDRGKEVPLTTPTIAEEKQSLSERVASSSMMTSQQTLLSHTRASSLEPSPKRQTVPIAMDHSVPYLSLATPITRSLSDQDEDDEEDDAVLIAPMDLDNSEILEPPTSDLSGSFENLSRIPFDDLLASFKHDLKECADTVDAYDVEVLQRMEYDLANSHGRAVRCESAMGNLLRTVHSAIGEFQDY